MTCNLFYTNNKIGTKWKIRKSEQSVLKLDLGVLIVSAGPNEQDHSYLRFGTIMRKASL